jgi:hypothetical protein
MGRVTRRVRVTAGELTCTGCGEIAIGYRPHGARARTVCFHCGIDDDGNALADPPPLVPTISYLRDGEYYVAAG